MVNLFVGIVAKYLDTSQAVKCCETLQDVQQRRGKNNTFVPYKTFDYKSKLDKHILYTGDKLMKIFTSAKILWAKQALLTAAGKKIFKFSIMIWINFLGKMLIWSLFLWYYGTAAQQLFRPFSKHCENFGFSFHRKCNKGNTLVTCQLPNALAYRMQLIELAATWMFLWTRVTSHHSEELPAKASNPQSGVDRKK